MVKIDLGILRGGHCILEVVEGVRLDHHQIGAGEHGLCGAALLRKVKV